MAGVTISYNGNQITEISATGTKVLQTEGKYCTDDIDVVYTAPNITSLTVTPTESQQVFNGDAQGNKIVEKSFTSSGTKTISPSLTVGDTYFWEVQKFTNGGYVLDSDIFGSFTCAASEQLTDTGVYISASSIRLATSNLDFVKVYIYEATIVDGYLPVTVNAVSSTYVGSGITRRSSSDLTALDANVSVPAGYYASSASKSVQSGSVGTPTATKGTVSDHSVSVTPSVTSTTGYIIGGTKNGTPVTVDVAELESGTKSITENGTGISVSGYSTVDVAVQAGTIIDDGDGNINLSPTGEVAVITPLAVNQNGTYTAPSNTGYSPVIVNVENNPVEPKDVNFIDYDGTLLYSYTKTEFANLSTLPANPTHAGLTSQGWNWTKAQITAQLTAMPNQPVWVGQMYVTTSGATEIDIELDNPDYLSPYLTIAVNGTISIDWGDGTTTSTVTGTSDTELNYTLHEYAAIGNYTIKIFVMSGHFTFYKGSPSKRTILSVCGVNSNREYNKVYTETIKRIFIGDDAIIGYYAFDSCYSLQSIMIPSNVTSIGDYAFNGCYSLQSITIPSNVTNIGSNTFYNCQSLQSITIPSNVTSIGSSAFNSCYSLQSITIPSGITSIGSNTFYNCYSLQSITIPSNVTSIGGGVFQNCRRIQSITILGNVTNIGTSVFFSCHSLRSVMIPSNVTSIGSGAFQNCSSLQSITIPSNVTNIEYNAFQACYSLQSITIPSNVTSIGSNAFNSCYGVEEYHITPTTPPTLSNTNAFNGIVDGTIIYVPSASLDTYKTASNWSTYASYMQGE